MNMKRNMRRKRLDLAGIDLTKVTTILCSPVHERMRRSMRATRSIRKIRRNDRFMPESAKSAESTISKIEIETIVPSSRFQPSRQ